MIPDEFKDPGGFALWNGWWWFRRRSWVGLTHRWRPLDNAAICALDLIALEQQES